MTHQPPLLRGGGELVEGLGARPRERASLRDGVGDGGELDGDGAQGGEVERSNTRPAPEMPMRNVTVMRRLLVLDPHQTGMAAGWITGEGGTTGEL
jgi:hypothetical protein